MAFPGWQLLRNRVLGNIFGFGVGAAAARAYEPAMRDVTARVERFFDLNRRLPPGQLAELVARGLRDRGSALGEAADQGYNEQRFGQLAELAGHPPGAADVLELRRRGRLGGGAAADALRDAGLRARYVDDVLALAEGSLAPTSAADAVARGRQDAGAGEAEAARSGITGERFELLTELAGRPPTVGQVLELVNRGRMPIGQARSALRDAGLRAEHVDDVLELRRYLIPPTDLIRLAVREVYTPEIRREFGLDEEFPEAFAERALRLGIDDESARDLWAGHWDLPSPTQGFEMYHRRIIRRDRLVQLLRALDYMPGWRDELIALAFRVPGRIDLRRMFRFGVIDRQRLASGYLDLGYAPDVVPHLVAFAEREKLGAERDLSKGEIVALYELRRMSRDDARAMLDAEGYDATEAGRILELADARRARKRTDAYKAAVRGRYLDRELTADEARAQLAGAGLPSEEIDAELELWTFTLAENPRHITEAQMRAAWLGGVVDEARYRRHLTQLGIGDEEAGILVRLYGQQQS